jgi:hypothetical protein
VWRKDSRPHLSPNLVSIRVWLGYNFVSEFGDKIPLDLIFFDPFRFGARVRVWVDHALRAVSRPERALSGVARSRGEVQRRWHEHRAAAGLGSPSLHDRVRVLTPG